MSTRKRPTKTLMYTSALLVLGALTASAQTLARDGAWGFVNVRYDTESAASIYTGYGWRAAFAMGGVTRNARTGRDELIGGVGAVIRTGISEHWIAVATAGAAEASSRQIYWLPAVRMRRLTTRAQVKWTMASGAQKLSISPLSVTLPLGRRVSGGVAADISAAARAPTRIGTGLELRVRLPGAVVGVDALRGVTGDASRVRLFFASRY